MDHRIHQVHQHHTMQIPAVKKPNANQHTKSDFKDVLADAQSLKISKHAKQRMNERNIALNETEWDTISEKMSEAKEKGVTDSLVITDNAALLVSTQNNTVVTAMNRDEASSRIFTNINGTILINE